MTAHHHHNHGCDHAHDHRHGHGHHHHHAPPASGEHNLAFAVAVGLNAAFVAVEVGAGIWSGSMALLADAGHNLADVLSLLLAWGAALMATRAPSARYTYGLKGTSILAALANAALLWAALGAILIETVRRLATPAPVSGGTVMLVAAAGILINGASAMLFARGSREDLNLRAAFQHLMADAAVSAGVVAAGAAVAWSGRSWIDPVTSLVITAIIALSSRGLLAEAVKLSLAAVPDGVDEAAVAAFLAGQTGVSAVHDLHIWPMSTTETALTAHLVMPEGHAGDAFLHTLSAGLGRHFGIHHATLQVETGAGTCALAPDEVV